MPAKWGRRQKAGGWGDHLRGGFTFPRGGWEAASSSHKGRRRPRPFAYQPFAMDGTIIPEAAGEEMEENEA